MRIFFCFYLLGTLLVSSQEKFRVMQVFGTITTDSLNQSIKPDDIISGNPTFHFSSKHDKALLLSNSKARVVLFQNMADSKPSGKLIYYFERNILPFKDYTGTRGFEQNTQFLFFDNWTLKKVKRMKISKAPSSSDSFYQISYSLSRKNYTRKLSIGQEGYLEIKPETFNNIGKYKLLPQQIKLSYYDSNTDTFIELNNLYFQSISIKQIKQEIEIYTKWLKELGEVDIENKVNRHLKSVYGNDFNLNH
ncbi:hypothetical protein [Maribacter sp. Hel_I_7]|uniref:hypothetical protein n=1 Tax=Maribacter sp. Hel_I_7 TaxID=1249997 RepID=UPI000AFF0419|nr:hypothetical protein [Maribacter sp. Hel_I_7]